jgi:hypothetical protein
MMRKLYLVRCFYNNKIFFALLIIFIAAVCYGHKTNLPITPAFISNVYILKGDTKKDSFLFITVNGTTLLNLHHTFDEPRRMMIYSTLETYRQAALNGGTDPELALIDRTVKKHPFLHGLRQAIGWKAGNYDHYLPWLLKYIRASVSDSVKRLDVGVAYIHYNDRNLPVTDSTKPLYHIE